MKDSKHFFLVTADPKLEGSLRALWPEDEVKWTCFGRGTSALEFLFSDPPDLLVVDEQLPDLAGADLIRLIKSENVYRQLPVVLCLASEDQVELLDFSTIEVDDFLVKPFEPVALYATLLKHLARQPGKADNRD